MENIEDNKEIDEQKIVETREEVINSDLPLQAQQFILDRFLKIN